MTPIITPYTRPETIVAWVMLALATLIGIIFPTTQSCIFILSCVVFVAWFWLRPVRLVSDFITRRKLKKAKKAKNV